MNFRALTVSHAVVTPHPSYGLRLNGLRSPLGPSGCDSKSCPPEKERNAPPDVEPAGAVKFRIVGEINGIRFSRGPASGRGGSLDTHPPGGLAVEVNLDR